MFRKKLKQKQSTKNKAVEYEFKLRGLGNTRIEALSDGVFAIAIALLLISTSVPEKFSELKAFINDFIPFGITIVLLTIVWFQHYLFFVRYGLKDATTVSINTLLLILILYYVYPLKFLFKTLYLLFQAIIFNDKTIFDYIFTNIMNLEDGNELMIIYGTGAMAIFFTLALLYTYAHRKQKQLQLSPVEVFDTRSSIYENILMGTIPLVSSLIAYFEIGGDDSFSISGMFYWSYMLVMPLQGMFRYKKRSRFINSLNPSPPQ